ncbi:MAG: hypothetical protein ABSF92_04155 [Candidatus Acidiferrales bacterium]
MSGFGRRIFSSSETGIFRHGSFSRFPPLGGQRVHRRHLSLLALLLLGLVAAWLVASGILSGKTQTLVYGGLAAVGGVILFVTLGNFRRGLYLFLGWLLFEDLARKFLGNNMVIYFAKDFLAVVVYISFFAAVRRKEVPLFRPPFLTALAVFFWFAVIQVFNPASTSLVFGLLGLKLYFYYVPLIFVGYALLDSEQQLQRFFSWNLLLAAAIALLGIIQAIAGPTFLNPVRPEEDIRELSTLYRMAPISGDVFYRPTSVFVSDGRYAYYLILCWILAFGVGGYLLFRSRRGRMLAFLTIAVVSAAIVLSGSRGSLLFTAGSALVATAAFLWGAPWRQRGVLRVVRVIQRTILLVGLALISLVAVYPEALGARLAFYSETLGLSSPAGELVYRARDYPVKNFLMAFEYPRWPYGYGTGTASLGGQYISRLLKVQTPVTGVESGYGNIIVEMGIVGLSLWLVWTIALAISAWRVVRALKNSPWFPLAFAIFWFAALLVFPMTYSTLTTYQNFVLNAYFWLLLGILFRLPTLAMEQLPAAPVALSPRGH